MADDKGAKIPEQPSRVLVADDEHLVATGLANDLRSIGFDVVAVVNDGDAAIDEARKLRPDLAILDIEMHEVSGLDAGAIIFCELGIPVIIVSSFTDPGYIDTASRFGAFGYLLKPVGAQQLRTTISVAWSRFRQLHSQNGEINSLRKRLDERKIIEQAKWIIVKRKGLSEPEAMKLLQRQARNNRKNLADVARSVIEHEDMFGKD